VGHLRPAFQAGPGVAGAGLAHGHSLRARRPGPPAGRSARQRARRMPSTRAAVRRLRLRRLGRRAERRYHPDQRHPRSSAGRRRARAGRGHRRALAAQRGPPGGLAGVRRVPGRCGPDHGRPRRECLAHRRRPGARLPAAVGHVHGGAGEAAARPRPDRGHGRPVSGRRPGRGALRRRGGNAGFAARRCSAGHPGPDGRGDVAALHPLRLRPEPGATRDRRGLRQPRTARGSRSGGRVLR